MHHLFATQVDNFGLAGFYRVLKSEITGANGTTFIFAGIRQNRSNTKPYESVDICWVEEATNVSKSSWDMLIPTIRKESSETWCPSTPTWPQTDTYKGFVTSQPSGATVIKIKRGGS